jgi:hypothetical protein
LDIVLHHGAKIRADSPSNVRIDGPDGLLTWPSRDRAILSLKSDADFQANSKSFQRIVKQWAARQRRYAGEAWSSRNRLVAQFENPWRYRVVFGVFVFAENSPAF